MSLQTRIIALANTIATDVKNLLSSVTTLINQAAPITTRVTAQTGDDIIVLRDGEPSLASVDDLLGGGGASQLPVDVVPVAPGQEIAINVNGVWKRTLIDSLINAAFPQPLGLWDYWYSFRPGNGNAAAADMFAGSAISSGTNNTAIPTASLLGYNDNGVFLRSSTTANGGYRYQTTSLLTIYFGTISRKGRTQFLWISSFTGRTVRTGFLDNITIADTVDGAYFEIVDSTCSAKTASNSVRTTSPTTITLSLDTAYTFDIDVNATGTSVRYRVYAGNDYSTTLMDVTITTNIPTTSARGMGFGIVATESSTTASDIGILYSLGLGTIPGFERLSGNYIPVTTPPSALVDADWSATPTTGGMDINIIAIPSPGTSGITEIRYRFDGGPYSVLSGTGTGVRNLTGLTPGQELAIQIQLVTAHGYSLWSDTKRRTPLAAATRPGTFTVGQWTLTPIAGGFAFNIISLPSDGGSAITALQYQINGGTWTNFAGTGTGVRNVTGLPENNVPTKIRAVNAIDAGLDSDTKSGTPLPAAGGGTVIFTQNSSGGNFGGVESVTFRQSGATNAGYWEPSVSSDKYLWRPGSNFNTTNIPGTVTSATLRIYLNAVFSEFVVDVYNNLRPWVIWGGGPSWSEYDNGVAWQTAGATGASDRSAATIGTSGTLPDVDGVWVEIDLDPAIVETWRQNGGVGASGVQMASPSTSYPEFVTDVGADGFRPQLVVEHS